MLMAGGRDHRRSANALTHGSRLWVRVVPALAAGATGQMPALVHCQAGDPIVLDPLAEALAGEKGFRLMEQWRLPGMPRENPTIGPRTRFWDDLVIEARGLLVGLGWGLDGCDSAGSRRGATR